jgi:hypothetical protein
MKNSVNLGRRSLGACLGAASLSFALPPAVGQSRNAYAVLSLVGDKLSVVTHLVVSGGHMDRNDKQDITLQDDAFDVAVARAVRDAIGGAGEVALFSTRDPAVFALQDQLGSGPSDAIPPELTSAARELLAASKATQFILITKHRGDVSIAMRDGHVGDGKVAGLGYYIDQDLRSRNLDTGVTSIGLLAPFAYLTATLIDAASLRTISQASSMASKAYLTGEYKQAGAPWDILSPSEKVNALVGVIKTAVSDAVPKVLAGH